MTKNTAMLLGAYYLDRTRACRGPIKLNAWRLAYIHHVCVQVTLYDTLGKTTRKERVTSENEAKRLAFYVFYNVKSDFDRWAAILCSGTVVHFPYPRASTLKERRTHVTGHLVQGGCAYNPAEGMASEVDASC